jgi:hypothetical protein
MMNWKGFERKQSWPNLRYNPGICLDGLRKTKKDLSKDSWYLGWDFTQGPPKCEAGVLTTQSQRSVTDVENVIRNWNLLGNACIDFQDCKMPFIFFSVSVYLYSFFLLSLLTTRAAQFAAQHAISKIILLHYSSSEIFIVNLTNFHILCKGMFDLLF